MIDYTQIVTVEQQQQQAEQRARELARQQALQYLRDTDWYIVRNQETGEPVPEQVLTQRAQARETASS